MASEDPRPDFGADLPPNPFAAPLASDNPRAMEATVLDGRPLNPWVSIWTKPRATIRQIVDSDPKRMTAPLVLMGGAVNSVSNVLSNDRLIEQGPEAMMAALPFAVILGPLIFFLFWRLISWFAKIAATRIGGVASYDEMACAYAWAQIPGIWAAPLMIPLTLLVFGVIDATIPGAQTVLMVTGLVQIVIAFWSIVIFSKLYGEVNRFSAWKGFATLLLSGLMLVGVFMAIIVPVVIAFSALG